MRKWFISITIVCLLSGLVLSLQLKTLKNNAANTNPFSQKNTNLVKIITDLEEEIKNQESQIAKIRSDLSNLQEQHSSDKLLTELKSELKKARIQAGVTNVSGKGIIITLDDNKEGLKAHPNDDPNKYIIHYEHILNLLSELKMGGAEAISINEQRIITTSEIRCVGNVILVNTTRIAPPFVIKVIGSPRLLAEIISSRELEILRSSSYPVSLEEKEQVIIPTYKGDLQFKYTKSVKES